MGKYNSEELSIIFSSDDFNEKYNEYIQTDKYITFSNFINKIELNTKYFRLTTNNKIGKNKRFRNKNISSDTITIKEINSLLNKLTDKNIVKIKSKIFELTKNKDYLKELIINNTLEKCLVHSNYIKFYIMILMDIYKDIPNIKDLIKNNTDKLYIKIKENTINEEQSEYLQFCDKNKNLDLLINYFILLTELEKEKIIHNTIKFSIQELFDYLQNTDNIDEKYKCTHCLYNIFKSYYGESLLPQFYIDKINPIISNEKCMKIKFKFMDLLERR